MCFYGLYKGDKMNKFVWSEKLSALKPDGGSFFSGSVGGFCRRDFLEDCRI